MSYGTPIKFKEKGDIKKLWDDFVEPYVVTKYGIRKLKSKEDVPTDYMFAVHCGCCVETLRSYGKKTEHPYGKFNDEIKLITTDYIALMANSSLQGNNNANFILSRKLGFIETQKIKKEEDKENSYLQEKFKRMSDDEFEKEFLEQTKGLK